MKTLIEVGGTNFLKFNNNMYHVYRFEPKRDLYKNLVDKMLYLKNYNVIPKAVSLTNGTMIFNTYKEDSDISYEVETVRLDTFIEENNLQDTIIDYIHIDAKELNLECLTSLGIYIKNVISGVIKIVNNINKNIYINQNENTYENIEKKLLENGFKITGVISKDATNCNIYFEKIFKKKIAVLIYGRLNKCVEHYDNIIESIGKEHEIDFFLSSDNSNKNLLDDFIRVYNPKSYINNPIIHYYILNKYSHLMRYNTHIHNMTCHFINKKRLLNLLEEYILNEKIHYDVVLSLRVDVKFNSSFYFKNISENTIYVPSDYNYEGINDQIAYGTINTMKKYMNIILKCPYLLSNSMSVLNPECLTLANILYYKLNIHKFTLKYNLDK
jgi:hypothetical protein